MKNILFVSLILLALSLSAQNEESSTRKFIDEADISQINKDWSVKAQFSSGIGETVEFFPIEVINLKTNQKVEALQVDMSIANPKIEKTAWVGLDEIDEFIVFIETY